MLRGESPSPFYPLSFFLSLDVSLFLTCLPLLSPFLFTPFYEPLTVHSHPTSITAQKFKEPNWPHLSQCWMQMEFLLLREVQLVTLAAPTPSIYCLTAKPACTSFNNIEPSYGAGSWDKEGTAVKWPLHWPHVHFIQFSHNCIFFHLPSSRHSCSLPFFYSLPHSCLLTHTHTHTRWWP